VSWLPAWHWPEGVIDSELRPSESRCRMAEWHGRRLGARAGEIRAYWARQWTMIDPKVERMAFEPDKTGRTVVTVHQLARDRAGQLMADKSVRHAYVIDRGRIRAMEIS
jgi:hypothetical protein